MIYYLVDYQLAERDPFVPELRALTSKEARAKYKIPVVEGKSVLEQGMVLFELDIPTTYLQDRKTKKQVEPEYGSTLVLQEGKYGLLASNAKSDGHGGNQPREYSLLVYALGEVEFGRLRSFAIDRG